MELRNTIALFYIKERNQTTTYPFGHSSPFNYFTSKNEIKPQLAVIVKFRRVYYFTSKNEIKPQHKSEIDYSVCHYFTSKNEIKPQL